MYNYNFKVNLSPYIENSNDTIIYTIFYNFNMNNKKKS